MAVVYFCQQTLKVAIVCLETDRGSHLAVEEVIVVLLELLAGEVLQEKQLGEIVEVVY